MLIEKLKTGFFNKKEHMHFYLSFSILFLYCYAQLVKMKILTYAGNSKKNVCSKIMKIVFSSSSKRVFVSSCFAFF